VEIDRVSSDPLGYFGLVRELGKRTGQRQRVRRIEHHELVRVKRESDSAFLRQRPGGPETSDHCVAAGKVTEVVPSFRMRPQRQDLAVDAKRADPV